MTKDALLTLLGVRWAQVRAAFPGWELPTLRAAVKPNSAYPHFLKARGFAVTFFDGFECTIWFAEKTLSADRLRVEAVARHEIGHVLDFYVHRSHLNAWALKQGVVLPSTSELRADALAELLFGDLIYYDAEDVQTLHRGVRPRPLHLGP